MGQSNPGLNFVGTNNSWGGGPASSFLASAIQTAGNNGHLFFAAAGNDTSDNNSWLPTHRTTQSFDLQGCHLRSPDLRRLDHQHRRAFEFLELWRDDGRYCSSGQHHCLHFCRQRVVWRLHLYQPQRHFDGDAACDRRGGLDRIGISRTASGGSQVGDPERQDCLCRAHRPGCDRWPAQHSRSDRSGRPCAGHHP